MNNSDLPWAQSPMNRPPGRANRPGGVTTLGPVPPVDPARDPLVGQKIGEYEVKEVLGWGGVGVVYRGVQSAIGKRVAIKVLRPEFSRDPEQISRLLGEADKEIIAGVIRHPPLFLRPTWRNVLARPDS